MPRRRWEGKGREVDKVTWKKGKNERLRIKTRRERKVDEEGRAEKRRRRGGREYEK